MHPVVSILCMFASAVLYGLPFPPLGWQPLAWIALVPVLVAMRRSSTPMALVVAWGFAAFGAYATADDLPRSVAAYYDQPHWLGIVLFFVMASFTTSTVMLGFAMFCRTVERLSPWTRPALIGAAWVGYEIVRARVLGNPWGDFGYSQVGIGPLVQIADVTGVFGISFVLATVNAAIAELLLARGSEQRRSALAGAGVAVAILACQLGYGVARPQSLATVLASEPSRVVIVQGNVDLGTQWRWEFYGTHLEEYMEMTMAAAGEREPALVVWPENAMTFFLETEPAYQGALGFMLTRAHAQLVAGGPHRPSPDESTYFNSAFLVDTNGVVLGRYDKQRLLPFAEYFPIPWLDFLRRRFGTIRVFTPGTDTPPLPTKVGAAGVMICNESLYGEIAGRRVADGAQILMNLTNDGWLGDERLSGVAFAMTTLRAVEQRRYIIRSSTSGPSAVIDPLGRVHGRTELLSRETTDGEVRALDVGTIYSRVGDLFALVCLALSAAVAVALRSTGRTVR